MTKSNFEKLEVYTLSENISDEIWCLVSKWPTFAQKTVGTQLVRAADGIGANIAEKVGRGTFRENRRFVRIARGSLNETKYWLHRACRRNLLTSQEVDVFRPLLDELAPRLNAYLRSISRRID